MKTIGNIGKDHDRVSCSCTTYTEAGAVALSVSHCCEASLEFMGSQLHLIQTQNVALCVRIRQGGD